MQRYEKATKHNKLRGKNMKTRLFIPIIILAFIASSCAVGTTVYYDDVYAPSSDKQYVEPVTPPQNNQYSQNQDYYQNQGTHSGRNRATKTSQFSLHFKNYISYAT